MGAEHIFLAMLQHGWQAKHHLCQDLVETLLLRANPQRWMGAVSTTRPVGLIDRTEMRDEPNAVRNQ